MSTTRATRTQGWEGWGGGGEEGGGKEGNLTLSAKTEASRPPSLSIWQALDDPAEMDEYSMALYHDPGQRRRRADGAAGGLDLHDDAIELVDGVVGIDLELAHATGVVSLHTPR